MEGIAAYLRMRIGVIISNSCFKGWPNIQLQSSNLSCFITHFENYPERLQNIYFNYALLAVTIVRGYGIGITGGFLGAFRAGSHQAGARGRSGRYIGWMITLSSKWSTKAGSVWMDGMVIMVIGEGVISTPGILRTGLLALSVIPFHHTPLPELTDYSLSVVEVVKNLPDWALLVEHDRGELLNRSTS